MGYFSSTKYISVCGLLSKKRGSREGEEVEGLSLSLLLIYQTKSPGSLCAINLTRQKV